MSATPQAEERIRKALAYIQEAQNLMGRANAELSTLRNIGTIWNRAGRTYDAIHKLWYSVRDIPSRRSLVTTDKEPAP